MEHKLHGIMLASSLALALGACDDVEEPRLEDYDALAWRTGNTGGVIVPNTDPGTPAAADDGGGGGGRTGGDWILNGLADPSVSGVSPAYALDSIQGLGAEGWLAEGDPAGEKTIHYLIECALDDGDEVTVQTDTETFVFEGRLGLAPEWKTAACDTTCQQWVSACMLARVNEAGEEVLVFVQGDSPSLGFGTFEAFSMYEGTFFGNVFTEPASMYACQGTGPGVSAAALLGRTCAQSSEACGFTVLPDCDTAADCTLAPGASIPTVGCQGDPAGPSYPGISVHVAGP